MFRNAEGKRFQDVTASGRFGQLQKGHAISFADFDRDGDQDIFEELGGAFPGDAYYSALLENPGHGNHWVGLKLEGVQSNRSAIGARVRVDVTTSAGKRSIFRVVNGGTSFGDSPLELHVGLEHATAITGIQIRWPAGEVQELAGIAPDRAYRIREGATPISIPLKRFVFHHQH